MAKEKQEKDPYEIKEVAPVIPENVARKEVYDLSVAIGKTEILVEETDDDGNVTRVLDANGEGVVNLLMSGLAHIKGESIYYHLKGPVSCGGRDIGPEVEFSSLPSKKRKNLGIKIDDIIGKMTDVSESSIIQIYTGIDKDAQGELTDRVLLQLFVVGRFFLV